MDIQKINKIKIKPPSLGACVSIPNHQIRSLLLCQLLGYTDILILDIVHEPRKKGILSVPQYCTENDTSPFYREVIGSSYVRL